ncbi:MAG: hypothetical protein ACLTDR_15705 [Adlercreutzia equolifaciens]
MVAVITIAVGLAVMGAFVVRQHRIPNPLLNLTPMHNRLFAPVRAGSRRHDDDVFHERASPAVLRGCPRHHSAGGRRRFAVAPILVNAVTSLVGGRVMDKRAAGLCCPQGSLSSPWGSWRCAFAPHPVACWRACGLGGRVRGRGLVPPSQTAGLQTLSPEQNPHGVAILNIVHPDCRRRGAIAVHRRAVLRGRLGRGRGHRCRPRPGGGFLGGRCCSVRHRGRGHVDRACLDAHKRQRLAEEQTTGAPTAEAAGGGGTAGETATLDNTMPTPAPCGHSSTSPDSALNLNPR